MEEKEKIQINKLSIPEYFWYNGQKINTIFKSNLLESNEAFGLAFHGNNQIQIQIPNIEQELKVSQSIVTYYHEVIHIILQNMGFNKESRNEQLVEVLATGFYQFNKFAKYSENIDVFLNNLRKKEIEQEKCENHNHFGE